MKVKTSITLSEDLLVAVDALVEPGERSRSAVIETAIRAFFRQRGREAQAERDLAILNASADRLNTEALDVLDYQVEL